MTQNGFERCEVKGTPYKFHQYLLESQISICLLYD